MYFEKACDVKFLKHGGTVNFWRIVGMEPIGMQVGGPPPPPSKNLQHPPCFKNSTPQAFSRNTARVFPNKTQNFFWPLAENILFLLL